MRLKAFIDQCYKRKIFKGFSIYAIVTWVIIQVAATTFPYLGIPKSAVTVIIIMVLVGLPISLIFSWYYNVIPDELDEKEKVDETPLDKETSKIFKIIVGAVFLVVVLIVILLIKNISIEKNDPPSVQETIKDLEIREGTIAVLDFKNFIQDENMRMLGKAAADWIAHSIVENNLAKVISSDMIAEYNYDEQSLNEDISNKILKRYLLPESIISGSAISDGENIIFHASISDGKNKETEHGFPEIIIDKDNPYDGIKELTSKILSFLTTAKKPNLNLEGSPPNFKAYSILEDAKKYDSSDPQSIALINKALELDSTYFEAQMLRLSHYYNKGAFAKADSIIQFLSVKPNANSRQRNLIYFYEALLSGKNKQIYESWKREYEHAPFYLPDNSTMMVLAMQFVNRPEEIASIYNKIDMTNMDISVCSRCKNRMYVKALADIELKNYEEAIELIKPQIDGSTDIFLLEPLIMAMIRSENYDVVDELFLDFSDLFMDDEWKRLYLFAGREFLLKNENERALRMLALAKDYFRSNDQVKNLAQTLIYSKDFASVEKLFNSEVGHRELSIEELTMLGIALISQGKKEDAREIKKQIVSKEENYDFGDTAYHLALMSAAESKTDETLNYLQKSIANGKRVQTHTFQNDPAFTDISNSVEFKKVLQYWH